jgi:hypothetical protein
MPSWNRPLGIAALTGLAMTMSGGACVIEFQPNPNQPPRPEPTQITIRLVNNSNVALDPELYVSPDAVSSDQLFQDVYRARNFGVAGLGILADFDSDTITVECAGARVIGTRGGRFGRNLNEPEGTGTRVVLAQDAQFSCGSRITFTFSRSGTGFSTSFAVSR